MTRREFFRHAFRWTGAGALGAFLYTWRIEPHWLEFVRRPLPIADLPVPLCGLRAAFLTDMHVGPVSESYLLGAFARVRALQPDLVFYTGDFVDRMPGVMELVSRLYALAPRGRLGTFGVLGNHDYGRRWSEPAFADELRTRLEDCGIRILQNEIARVGGLQIAGLGELWAGRFDPRAAFAQLDPAQSALALVHNPDAVDRPGWERFRGWILAGHTHGGQCKPPFLPPPLLPVKNRRYTSGEFGLAGGRRLYIGRGVGYVHRVRFNVRPEVTWFELERG